MLLNFDLLLALALHVVPQAAAYDGEFSSGPNQISGLRLDLHVNIDPYSLAGLGFRVEFPLVRGGLLRGGLSDDLALSIGSDFLIAPLGSGWWGYDGGSFMMPVAAVQWNLYIGDQWSIFPEIGLALHMGFDGGTWGDEFGRDRGWIYPALDLGFGVRLHLNPNVALMLKVSSPGGLQLGVVF